MPKEEKEEFRNFRHMRIDMDKNKREKEELEAALLKRDIELVEKQIAKSTRTYDCPVNHCNPKAVATALAALQSQIDDFSEEEKKEISASEAIYLFCGLLTTRDKELTVGAKQECAEIAELAKDFCEKHNLKNPNW